LVIATAKRHVVVYDLRYFGREAEQRRESSLKFATKALQCMPNGQGYVMSSIEGRVAVEFFDLTPQVQAKKYAFKCHRQTVDGVDLVYPVNALAFHPTYGTFASGGADGTISIWDGVNKKRIKQLRRYPCSIASLAFSSNGSKLAIASSYTYEEGNKDTPPDTVFIRALAEVDVRPKIPPTSATS